MRASDISIRNSGGRPGGANEGLEPAADGFLANSLRMIFGVILVGLLAIVAASLATWSVNDPSISHATDGTTQNLFGFFGASLSDLLMQFFGLSTVLILIPAAMIAWRLCFSRPIAPMRRRMLAWLVGTLAATAAIGSLPIFENWPLPNGLGGIVGDGILKLPAVLIGDFPSGIWALICFLLFGAVAVWSLAFAGFLIRRPDSLSLEDDFAPNLNEVGELDDDDRAPGLLLGMAAHATLSTRYHMHRGWLRFSAWRAERARVLAEKKARLEAEEAGLAMQFAQPADQTVTNTEFSIGSYDQQAGTGWGQTPSSVEHDQMPPQPYAEAPHFEPDPAPPAYHEASAAGFSPAEPMEPMGRVQPAPAPVKQSTRVKREAQPALPIGNDFELPALAYLTEPTGVIHDDTLSSEALEQNARLLEGVLEDFGVKGQIINVRPGPVVTLYELEPAPGIKSSRVIGLADDIARSMSAISARVAVVPGRNAIGIELPNARRETVFLRELMASHDYEKTKASLPLGLGKTIGGEPVVTDLAKTPHLLVAGTTGSGKSVSINTMILSLLYKLSPDQCRMIMIDPKMLELSVYDGIPHLLTPVVTDPKKAVVALKWTVREMEERYKNMSKLGVRNITGYNNRVAEAKRKGEPLTRTVQTGYDKDTGQAIYETEDLNFEHMPFIVVVIDEMADLMMVAGKDIEGAVQRLAQMARAAGIHVIMATQRPSVDVITGTIKANFPSRISFSVTSKIDSRTILGEQGAEQLLGMGDMLFMAGGGKVQRVHGAFVDDDEVEQIVAHLKTQGVPQYLEAITEDDEAEGGEGGSAGTSNLAESDDPYDQAVAIVLRDGKASTSYVQRRLGIGYNRAASIIERMEDEGVIGPANHAGKREILVPTESAQDDFV
jgi:S-DNA-T family DNA segregation ATPase FtsK/SpoIIIE